MQTTPCGRHRSPTAPPPGRAHDGTTRPHRSAAAARRPPRRRAGDRRPAGPDRVPEELGARADDHNRLEHLAGRWVHRGRARAPRRRPSRACRCRGSSSVTKNGLPAVRRVKHLGLRSEWLRHLGDGARREGRELHPRDRAGGTQFSDEYPHRVPWPGSSLCETTSSKAASCSRTAGQSRAPWGMASGGPMQVLQHQQRRDRATDLFKQAVGDVVRSARPRTTSPRGSPSSSARSENGPSGRGASSGSHPTQRASPGNRNTTPAPGAGRSCRHPPRRPRTRPPPRGPS